MRGFLNRALALCALEAPSVLRPALHRLRGVRVGRGVWIGPWVRLETSEPERLLLEDRCRIGMGSLLVGHFRDMADCDEDGFSVRIHREAFVGARSVVLPNTELGEGCVLAAGSVARGNLEGGVLYRGNPCRAVMRCRSLAEGTSYAAWKASLRPL